MVFRITLANIDLSLGVEPSIPTRMPRMRLAEEAQRAADSKLERLQLRDDGSVNIDE